ncbi:transposase family protein [Streptomyces cyaneofuscatus]
MCRQSATVYLIKSPSRQQRALPSLAERLAVLPDPRRRRGVRHPFVAVLLAAVCAVTAGARSWAAIGQGSRSAPRDTLAARCPHRGRPADTLRALAVHRPPRRERRVSWRAGGPDRSGPGARPHPRRRRQERLRFASPRCPGDASPGRDDRPGPHGHPAARAGQDQRDHLLHRPSHPPTTCAVSW